MEFFEGLEAWTVEPGDRIILQGEPVEVFEKNDTDDPDEILITGYSHETGEMEKYPVVWDEMLIQWRP